MAVKENPYKKYLREDRLPHIFCPGCGNGIRPDCLQFRGTCHHRSRVCDRGCNGSPCYGSSDRGSYGGNYGRTTT